MLFKSHLLLKGANLQISTLIRMLFVFLTTRAEEKGDFTIAKSSFNTQNVTAHSSEHLNRQGIVTYLLDHSSKDNSYWNSRLDIEQFKKDAQISYTEHHKQNQRMQKSQFNTLIKEAVINLNADSNMEDIKTLFTEFNTIFGGYVAFEIGIHRDEGIFVEFNGKKNNEWDLDDYVYNSITMQWFDTHGNEVMDIIAHRPERDLFYGKETDTWYTDKKLTTVADMSILKKFHNYHAHVIYSTFDLSSGKGRTTRENMRSIQTLTAKILKMERGERFSKTKRGTHWQRKQEADAVNDTKKKYLEKQKNTDQQTKDNKVLKEENGILKRNRDAWKKTSKELRKKLQLQKAQRAHYAQLEAKQKDILEKIESGIYSYDVAIEILQKTGDEIRNSIEETRSSPSKRVWLDNQIGEMVEQLDENIIKVEEILGTLSKYCQPENIIPKYEQELENIVNQLDKQIENSEYKENYLDLDNEMQIYENEIIRLKIQKTANLEIKIEHFKLEIERYDRLLKNTDKYRELQTKDEVFEINQLKKESQIELDALNKQLEVSNKEKKSKKKKPRP